MKIEFKKNFKSYLFAFILSKVIGVTIFLIYFILNKFTMYASINGTSLAAIVLISISGLMFVSYEGFFDIFSFGFKQLGSSMFGKKGNETKDFAGYKEQKRVSREESPKFFLSILASGLIFLVAMVVLRIIELTV